MKTVFSALLLFVALLPAAKAGVNKSDVMNIKKLAQLLNSKSLQCTPKYNQKTVDPAYRGDEGYFNLDVRSKAISITDAGTSGYGFSNGSFQDIAFADQRLYLSVGDDGFQTLVFDFNEIGARSELQNNCAAGILLDASEGAYDLQSSIDLICCLE